MLLFLLLYYVFEFLRTMIQPPDIRTFLLCFTYSQHTLFIQAKGSTTKSKPLKQITVETFEEMVEENIDLFEMTREEAVQETLQQLHAQGVCTKNLQSGTLMSLH